MLFYTAYSHQTIFSAYFVTECHHQKTFNHFLQFFAKVTLVGFSHSTTELSSKCSPTFASDDNKKLIRDFLYNHLTQKGDVYLYQVITHFHPALGFFA